jgi:hypothetical protein
MMPPLIGGTVCYAVVLYNLQTILLQQQEKRCCFNIINWAVKTMKSPSAFGWKKNMVPRFAVSLKVHKIKNFFDIDFGICVISLLVMSKYKN